jgi:hypothetical protein
LHPNGARWLAQRIMEVIPAIDLLDGKAVRLMKGRYET